MSREDTSRQGKKPRPDAVPTPSRVCTIATPDYRQFIDELKSRVVAARLSAARAVNRDLVLLYWTSASRPIGFSPRSRPRSSRASAAR